MGINQSRLYKYSHLEKIGIFFGRTIFLLFLLIPFFEMFTVSLKSLGDVKSIPYRFLPQKFSWENYGDIWKTVPLLWRYILNSFFLGIAVSVVNLCIAVPAGYSFSRFRFFGRKVFLIGLLGLTMFSGTVLLVPLYRLFQSLRILNTYMSIILPGAVFLLPVNIWLLKSYLDNLSYEIDEAVYVDGASVMQTLGYIIIPIIMPSIVVVGIRTFIAAYAQQFIFAITFNRKQELMPITQGLFSFFSRTDVVWNQLMAACIVASLPVLILFLFMQKSIVRGLTTGSLKG